MIHTIGIKDVPLMVPLPVEMQPGTFIYESVVTLCETPSQVKTPSDVSTMLRCHLIKLSLSGH